MKQQLIKFYVQEQNIGIDTLVNNTDFTSFEVIQLLAMGEKYYNEAKRYNVVKVMRKSERRKVIRRGCTLQEAQRICQQTPCSTKSMVVYTYSNNVKS